MKVQTLMAPIRHIFAVLPHAGISDVRYYLNAVMVEVKNGKVYCVATQGHTLAACIGGEAKDADGNTPDDCQVIISRLVLRELVMTARNACEDVTISAPTVDSAGVWQIKQAGREPRYFSPIDGKYPDWRAAVPRVFDNDGQACQFDPLLMAIFSKSSKALGCKFAPTFRYNGEESPAIAGVYNHPEFLGVIMPYRISPPSLPAWLDEDEKADAS